MPSTQCDGKCTITVLSCLTALLYLALLYFIPRSIFLHLTYLSFYYLSLLSISQKMSSYFLLSIALAILFRLFAVFNLPALSDKNFRFIWVGKMFLMYGCRINQQNRYRFQVMCQVNCFSGYFVYLKKPKFISGVLSGLIP